MASIDWDLLSSYAGLLTLASGSIYVGSFGSVKRDRSAREEIDIDDIDVVPEQLQDCQHSNPCYRACLQS